MVTASANEAQQMYARRHQNRSRGRANESEHRVDLIPHNHHHTATTRSLCYWPASDQILYLFVLTLYPSRRSTITASVKAAQTAS